MQIKNFLLVSVVLATVVIQSCVKESNKSPKEILLNGNWRIHSATIINPGTPTANAFDIFMDSCEADNIYTFKDSNVLLVDAGPIKCSASDPQIDATFWDISPDGKSLTMYQSTSHVLSITNDTLVISYDQISIPGSLKFVFTNH